MYIYIYIVVRECVNAQYAARMQCFEIILYVILPIVCFGLPYMWRRLVSALQVSLLTKVKFMKFLRLCLQNRWNNDDVINFCAGATRYTAANKTTTTAATTTTITTTATATTTITTTAIATTTITTSITITGAWGGVVVKALRY
jgi:hypothetical protein